MSAKQAVAVAGLGLMGGAIATNLADYGHDVCSFDPEPAAAAAERARCSGVDVMSSLGKLAPGLEIADTHAFGTALAETAFAAPLFRRSSMAPAEPTTQRQAAT